MEPAQAVLIVHSTWFHRIKCVIYYGDWYYEAFIYMWILLLLMSRIHVICMWRVQDFNTGDGSFTF
jgi:hypothetical protein